ncbi:MAG: hypothetical protein CBB97_06215 [Candidatus Endolissoclinum sp. TMED37]|nr:MAG: hypothetical protein CBB97_06215 [Candidatus Endolissoclinum sp. TMED37]
MSTYTRDQMNAILQAIQANSGKKMNAKLGKILETPDKKISAEKIVEMINGSRRDGTLKKPKNAWQLFLADFRENSKEVEVGMNGAAIVKLASPVWEKMTDDQKKPFTEEATKLSKSYKDTKNEMSPKKKQGEKRPPNAWMLFLAHYRKDNAEPGVAGSKVTAAAGEVWREMSNEDKLPYETNANKLKEDWNAKKEKGPKDVEDKPKTKKKVSDEKKEDKKQKKQPAKKTKKDENAPAPEPPAEVVEEEDSDIDDSSDEE